MFFICLYFIFLLRYFDMFMEYASQSNHTRVVSLSIIPDAYHPFVGRTLKILCYSYLNTQHTARIYCSISDNDHDTEPVRLLTNGCSFEDTIF